MKHVKDVYYNSIYILIYLSHWKNFVKFKLMYFNNFCQHFHDIYIYIYKINKINIIIIFYYFKNN